MNVLLIGGAGSFIDNTINKLNKEGQRIFLLTGNRYGKLPYQKVFERYDFTYDAECLKDIFESCTPDVTIFMGAFDTNFNWKDGEKTSIRFSNAMTNILMSYAMNKAGRFIFLSSEEVFGGNYEEDISENETPKPQSLKGLALSQAEELCRIYRESRNLDIVTVRLDHYYSIPVTRRDVHSIPGKMCLELLEKEEISYIHDNRFSLLYETDAVESIYQLVKAGTHRHSVYNISSSEEVSDDKILNIIEKVSGQNIVKIKEEIPPRRCILAADLYNVEFGKPLICNSDSIIQRIYEKIFKNKYIFLTGADSKPPFWKRVKERSGWFIKIIIPFLENIVCFAVFLALYYFIGDIRYFEKLDILLLYVFLFAVIYGQQQAIFSAVLATVGYFALNIVTSSAAATVFDINSYIWVAQIFLVGLVSGYLKDQITALKNEEEEKQEFLSSQLNDMQDINNSNVRVKDALESQLVNQYDSVGKIYRITSELEQYSPEEVLFYAADVIAKLMDTKDVAIYTVSDGPYARLFSSTSKKAKSLGNSIVYEDYGELYEAVSKHRVYINRKLDESMPLMANAVFAEDKMQVLVFVWGLPWERMTLGQANQLTVACYLIQNAVIRANRYLEVLENERFVNDSRLLNPEAMRVLIKAYLDAERKGLADCTVLKVDTTGKDAMQVGIDMADRIRQSDYLGMLDNGGLYALLPNTSKDEAIFAMKRISRLGYPSEIAKEFEI